MPSLRISPEEANAVALAAEPIVYLDSRNEQAWSTSDEKIPGAIRVPADDMESHLNEINRDATVIAYCT
jgi:rhodanese-related sulfurtransferase